MEINCCAIVADKDESSLHPASHSCERATVPKAVPKWRHRPPCARKSMGARIRRRRRPKTSIAALFLRFSRSGGIGKRQSLDKERSCNPTIDEELHSGDDEASCEGNSPPVTVTPPRYADILKARRAMIKKESTNMAGVCQICVCSLRKIHPKKKSVRK